MDLSRQEYPGLLKTLSPTQTVGLVNDRVDYISKTNNAIADWLEERRRIEEAYVNGLRKLARKRLDTEGQGLGAFSSAWKRILSSAEEIALSHQALARAIENDVEKPLRSFGSTNREMQAMSTIRGNLASVAKDLEKKGSRGSSDEWDSQAPYVMEQLQAADEGRCNHLRDALTQFQTHEVDQVERNRVTAEQCLNEVLTVDTADEIKMFAIRSAQDGDRVGASGMSSPAPSAAARTPQRGSSRMPPRSETNSSLNVPSAGPAGADDAASQRSGSVHEEEKKRGGLRGLKRLGTVLKGKRNSMMPGSSSTPPAKNAKNRNAPPSSSQSQAFNPVPPIREDDSTVSTPTREAIRNLDSAAIPEEPALTPAATNGTRAELAGLQLQEPLQPTALAAAADAAYEAPPGPPPKSTTLDSDGYSAPAARYDPISQAEQEAASSEAGPSARQFDVDIRNKPIAEEDGEASTAMASMASSLRAQAEPTRRNTTRGRRDVRNTMFVPSSPMGDSFGGQPPLPSIPQESSSGFPPSAPSSSNLIMTPFISSIAGGQSPSPVHRSFPGVARTESDSDSIRSGRSSVAGTDIYSKHGDMSQQGLNVSMVETVSAWFEQGTVTRATVIGEMALAHNAGSFPSTSTSESIRIDNFAALEKVAPNPAFVTAQGAQGGEYSIDVANLSRGPQVAFKYQVHVDQMDLMRQAPIFLSPMWRIEPTQTSVIMTYGLNPALGSSGSPVHVSNLSIIVSLDTTDPSAGKALSCQSKPAGSFSRERGAITVRIGNVTLYPGAPPEKVLARFSTEGMGKQGKVEARWEISSAPATLGSGLGVSMLESGASASADPFADDDGGGNGFDAAGSWRQVNAARKLVSGTYQAN